MEIKFFALKNYIGQNDLPVDVHFHSQRLFSMHYHDFTELVFVLSGYGTHLLDGESHPVSRGDVFVIKPGIPHGYKDHKDLSIANVLIDFSSKEIILNDLKQHPGFYALFEVQPLLQKSKRPSPRLRLSGEDMEKAYTYLKEIKQERGQSLPGYRFAVLNSFSRLLLLVSRRYEQPPEKPTENMMRLSMMLRFIEKNYMKDITRDEIVAAAHISASSGSRIFQKLLGKKIIEHLTQVRIDHAATLLSRNIKITEIASQCGFKDSNYFSTVFTHFTGKSPSAYRKTLAQGKTYCKKE